MHYPGATSSLAAEHPVFSGSGATETGAIKIENVPIPVIREFRAQCARMGIRQAEGFTQAVVGWLQTSGTLVQ